MFRILAMFLGATTAIASCTIPLGAQSVPAANQSDLVSIHISLQKSSYVIGEKPIAVMAIKNISSKEVWFSGDPYLERVHIKSKNGSPPKTEFYRHLRGEFRRGDGPGLESGPVVGQSIAPGSVLSLKYDLTAYYDLSKPGEYRVYLEIYDPAGPKNGHGNWLRTNTAKFTIEAPGD